MEEIVIQAKTRDVTGKQVKALRRDGVLPAVIYGKARDSIKISLDYRESSRVLPTITSSQLVVVDVDGKKHTTLVRERQRQPVSGELLHIDFLEVSMTEKLRTQVMIELVGESAAVKNASGILVSGLEELHVEAYPRDLPERISVDISSLGEVGDAIYVRDLQAIKGVEILENDDEIIAVITSPAAEEEPEEAEEEIEEGEEPEVIERGKREEEQEE